MRWVYMGHVVEVKMPSHRSASLCPSMALFIFSTIQPGTVKGFISSILTSGQSLWQWLQHTHRQSPSLMGMCTHCYHGNIPKWTYLYSSVWDRSWMSSSISRYAWEKTTKDIKPELRKGFDGHVTGSYLPFSLLLPSCGVSLPATVCPSHLQHTDTGIHTHTVITVHASVTK